MSCGQIVWVWRTSIRHSEFFSIEMLEFVILIPVWFLKNGDFVFGRDLEPASIEGPVVQSAECNPVANVVTTVLAPWIDMRSFDFGCPFSALLVIRLSRIKIHQIRV